MTMLTRSRQRHTPYQIRVIRALDLASDIHSATLRLLMMGYPLLLIPAQDGAVAVTVYCADDQDFAAADRLLQDIKL